MATKRRSESSTAEQVTALIAINQELARTNATLVRIIANAMNQGAGGSPATSDVSAILSKSFAHPAALFESLASASHAASATKVSATYDKVLQCVKDCSPKGQDVRSDTVLKDAHARMNDLTTCINARIPLENDPWNIQSDPIDAGWSVQLLSDKTNNRS